MRCGWRRYQAIPTRWPSPTRWLCSVVLHSVVLRSVVLRSGVLCSGVLRSGVLRSGVLRSVLLRSVVLRSGVLRSGVLCGGCYEVVAHAAMGSSTMSGDCFGTGMVGSCHAAKSSL